MDAHHSVGLQRLLTHAFQRPFWLTCTQYLSSHRISWLLLEQSHEIDKPIHIAVMQSAIPCNVMQCSATLRTHLGCYGRPFEGEVGHREHSLTVLHERAGVPAVRGGDWRGGEWEEGGQRQSRRYGKRSRGRCEKQYESTHTGAAHLQRGRRKQTQRMTYFYRCILQMNLRITILQPPPRLRLPSVATATLRQPT